MTKPISTFIFSLSVIAILSCNNSDNKSPNATEGGVNKKTAKEIIKADTVHVNKSASTFYAICADEHFGWCSPSFPTYDEANAALESHRKSTGLTDNTISNDCPF